MTVFLAQVPHIAADGTIPDFSDASRFGNIAPIFQAGDQPARNLDFSRTRIREKLEDFDPKCDHILWVRGDNLILMLISFELLRLRIGSFSWLRYSRKLDNEGERTKTGEYFPVKIDLTDFLSDPGDRTLGSE